METSQLSKVVKSDKERNLALGKKTQLNYSEVGDFKERDSCRISDNKFDTFALAVESLTDIWATVWAMQWRVKFIRIMVKVIRTQLKEKEMILILLKNCKDSKRTILNHFLICSLCNYLTRRLHNAMGNQHSKRLHFVLFFMVKNVNWSSGDTTNIFVHQYLPQLINIKRKDTKIVPILQAKTEKKGCRTNRRQVHGTM